jgi:HNH endonuclease
MRPDEREELRARFRHSCGYCGTSEVDVGADLTVDHFHPQSRGGLDEAYNWVYCCHACNEFKADYWDPGSRQRILHPLRDSIAEHITEGDDGNLYARSETGAFHIQKLRLNRAGLVAQRLRRRLSAIKGQIEAEVWQRLDRIEQRLQEISLQLAELGRHEVPE